MGSAPCKGKKSSEVNPDTKDVKNITIGVFGLSNAGKTSTIKAIEGAPTKDAAPTVGSATFKVPNPTKAAGGKKKQGTVQLIDVSGQRKFRDASWPEYYGRIHGLIFVIDVSEKKPVRESREILEDLLKHEQLKGKPILILANKQDQDGAIDNEDDLKRKLEIDRLRAEHKIEFCTALPQKKKGVDPSIRDGFSWLTQAIEKDYSSLNARVNRSIKPDSRSKDAGKGNSRHGRSESDSNHSDFGYNGKRAVSPMSRGNDFRNGYPSAKLPSLDLNKNKSRTGAFGHETYSENDDDDDVRTRPRSPLVRSSSSTAVRSSTFGNRAPSPPLSGLSKKKKLTGVPALGISDGKTDLLSKKSRENEPKSFRSSYETFPEAAPWSAAGANGTKLNTLAPRSYGKPPTPNDSIKRNVSPLVFDAKPSGNGSSFKYDALRKHTGGDDDDLYSSASKSKAIPLPYSRSNETNGSDLYGNSKYPSSTPAKKPYSHDDADRFAKKSTVPSKLPAYDSDDDYDKAYPRASDRLTTTNDYRVGSARSPLLSSNKPAPLSTSVARSKYDDYPTSSSKPSAPPRYDDDIRPLSAAKPAGYSKFHDDNYGSSAKSGMKSKFDSDPYSSSTSKPAASSRSNYDYPLPSSSRTGNNFKYDDDDDDDDLPASSTKYGSRSKNDDYHSSSLSSKPAVRGKYDDDYTSKASKPAGRSTYDDDDDDDYDDRPSSLSKTNGRSKYGGGDDDYRSPSRSGVRSNYDDNYGSSTAKKTTYPSRNDDYGSRSKNRSGFEDDDFP